MEVPTKNLYPQVDPEVFAQTQKVTKEFQKRSNQTTTGTHNPKKNVGTINPYIAKTILVICSLVSFHLTPRSFIYGAAIGAGLKHFVINKNRSLEAVVKSSNSNQVAGPLNLALAFTGAVGSVLCYSYKRSAVVLVPVFGALGVGFAMHSAGSLLYTKIQKARSGKID